MRVMFTSGDVLRALDGGPFTSNTVNTTTRAKRPRRARLAAAVQDVGSVRRSCPMRELRFRCRPCRSDLTDFVVTPAEARSRIPVDPAHHLAPQHKIKYAHSGTSRSHSYYTPQPPAE